MTLARFRRAVTIFKREKDKAVVETIEEYGKDMRRVLATLTPKDTGRAAASWNVSLHQPDTEIQSKSYNNPGGAVNDGNVNLDGIKAGDILFVTNAIPYIRRLNAGWSRQAPAGFVQQAIAIAGDRAGGVARRVRRRLRLG